MWTSFSLLLAAEYCRPVILRQLLTDGHDSQQPDFVGMTPLQAACRIGNIAMVTELLKHGADGNWKYNLLNLKSNLGVVSFWSKWNGKRRLHSSTWQRFGRQSWCAIASTALWCLFKSTDANVGHEHCYPDPAHAILPAWKSRLCPSLYLAGRGSKRKG